MQRVQQIAQKLPESDRKEILGFIAQYQSYSFSGPLPDPGTMKRYADIIPNFPERVVSEWEAEGKHRRSLERVALIADIVITVLGQVIGLLALLALCASGIYLTMQGHDKVGIAVFACGIGGIVAVFVRGASLRKPKDAAAPKPKAPAKKTATTRRK